MNKLQMNHLTLTQYDSDGPEAHSSALADCCIKGASHSIDCTPTAVLTSGVFLRTFTNIGMLIHDSPTYHLPPQMVAGGMLILS